MESRGNPLNEFRGKRKFHSDWDAKSVRVESWWLTIEVVSLAVLWMDSRTYHTRRFGRDLTCKEQDGYNILPVGPSGSTLIKKTTKLGWRDFHFAVVSKLSRMQLWYQRGNHRLSKVARMKWLTLHSLYACEAKLEINAQL